MSFNYATQPTVYGSTSSPRKAKQEFQVTFKLYYKTIPGQDLFVIGDIAEFGSNVSTDNKIPLTWTAGHVWVSDRPVITNSQFFKYKYIMVDQRSKVRDDETNYRVADLDVMGGYQNSNRINMEDEWESFKIRFTVFHPIIHANQSIRISGNTSELGNWATNSSPIVMRQSNKLSHWMVEKYGENVRPYEAIVSFKNKYFLSGKSFTLQYNYSLINGNRGNEEWERDPHRILEIHDVSSSIGAVRAQHSANPYNWQNTNSVSLVNGFIDKNDGNFLQTFNINKIGDTNIFTGAYPGTDHDVKRIFDSGINAILNLQTQAEMTDLNIDWTRAQDIYRRAGIHNVMHFPIDDFATAEKAEKYFQASQYLNDMINNQGLKVFVHGSSAISRAPTAILTYLTMYKRVNVWKDVNQSERYIHQYQAASHSNVSLVQKIVHDNAEFQSQQVDISYEQAEKLRLRLEAQKQKSIRLQDLLLQEQKLKEAHQSRLNEMAESRRKNQLHQQQLDEEMKRRVLNYKNKINDDIQRRTGELNKEEVRIQQYEIDLNNLQQNNMIQHDKNRAHQFKLIGERRNQLDHELKLAREQRTQNENELEMAKERLQIQRDNHLREMENLKNQQNRIKQERVEHDQDTEKNRLSIIEESEAILEELRRRIIRSEQIIQEEASRGKELNQEEIERQCDQLFGQGPPIQFIPRKGNALDQRMFQLIVQENIRVPIIWIREQMYLIGSKTCMCQIKQQNVTVNVGGGYHVFEEFVPYNHRIFERTLVINMINSGQSLEFVCDQLCQGQRIKDVVYPLNRQTTGGAISSPERRLSTSPTYRQQRSGVTDTSDQSPNRYSNEYEKVSPKSRVSVGRNSNGSGASPNSRKGHF